MDDFLRDIDTGAELWNGRLPAGGQATPMTYRLRTNGKQFVVIAAGGHSKIGTNGTLFHGDLARQFITSRPPSRRL